MAWGPVVATVDDSRRTGAVGAVRTLVVYAALPRSGVVLDAATGEVLWADELPFSAPLVPADNGQMTAVCSAGYAFIVSATYSTKPAAPGPIFVSVYDVGAPAVALVANFSYAVGGSVVSNVAVSPACDSLYVLYESYMTGGAIGNFLSLLSFDASTGAVAERHTQLIPELPAWGGSAFHLALGPRPGQAVISSRPSGQSPAVVALSEAAALVE